jgi:hypothetical protein
VVRSTRHSTTQIVIGVVEAFLLGEVSEVFDVERGEGELTGDAAGRQPNCRWPAAIGRGVARVPGSRPPNGLTGGAEDTTSAGPALSRSPTVTNVIADVRARQMAGEMAGQTVLEDGRGDIGVKDDRITRDRRAARRRGRRAAALEAVGYLDISPPSGSACKGGRRTNLGSAADLR